MKIDSDLIALAYIRVLHRDAIFLELATHDIGIF